MQQELFEAEREQRYLEATSKQRGAAGEGRGILPFVLRADEEADTVTGRAGLPLVVEAFRGYRGDELVQQHLRLKQRARGYTEAELVEDFLLLQASGGEHLEDFTVLREDAGLCRLLDRELPSPDVARNFLLRFHDEQLLQAAQEAAAAAGEKSYVPQENAALQVLPAWVSERYFRADSACYEEKVLKWLVNEQRPGGPAGPIGFTISADMTTDLRERCVAVLEAGVEPDRDLPHWCMLDDLRANEFVEWAEVEFTPGDWPKNARPLRYLVLRIQKRQGCLFASGERYKYLGVATNREGDGAALIRWHWGKAGTIEHVHDETKNGLGAGVLPCAEFGANAAWYRLTMLTYNVLTMIKRETLPPAQQQAKAKRVRFLIFNLAARLTRHARCLFAYVKAAALRRASLWPARLHWRDLCRHALPAPAG